MERAKQLNWTKGWPNKTWKVEGARLKDLKDAFEAKSKGLIKDHIKKLKENERLGKGWHRSRATIKSFSFHLVPERGEKSSYVCETFIVPGATEISKVGKSGSGGSLVSPTPPPQP